MKKITVETSKWKAALLVDKTGHINSASDILGWTRGRHWDGVRTFLRKQMKGAKLSIHEDEGLRL